MLSGSDILGVVEEIVGVERFVSIRTQIETEYEEEFQRLETLFSRVTIKTHEQLGKLVCDKIDDIIDLSDFLDPEEREAISDAIGELIFQKMAEHLDEIELTDEERAPTALEEILQKSVLPDEETTSKLSGIFDDQLPSFVRQSLSIPIPTEHEQHILSYHIRNYGDQRCIDHLVLGNLRFVVFYLNQYKDKGIAFLDLFQEAVIGLTKAASRFDSRQGKFTTYARWWIFQSVTRLFQNQSGNIRTPVHIQDKQRKTRALMAEFLGYEETEPTDGQIRAFCRHHRIDEAQYRTLMDYGQRKMLYLDAQIGDDPEDTYHGATGDDLASRQMEDHIDRNHKRTVISKLLALEPSERNRKIIIARLGLETGEMRTLEDVGEEFDMTRERVRQLVDLLFIGKIRRQIEQRRAGSHSDKTSEQILADMLSGGEEVQVGWYEDFIPSERETGKPKIASARGIGSFLEGKSAPKTDHMRKRGRPPAKKSVRNMKTSQANHPPFQGHLSGEQLLELSPLYEPQLPVLRSVLDGIAQGHTDGYVQGPPRMGKTVVFTDFLKHFFHYLRQPGQKAIVVVPTTTLMTQTVEKIEQFFPGIGVGMIYGKKKQPGRDITVITYHSLNSWVDNGRLQPFDYGCVILDEAHRALSDWRMETIDQFHHAIRIGFTATSAFTDDKSVGNFLGHEYSRMSILQGIQRGLVTPFQTVYIPTQTDLSNVTITSLGDYHKRQLEDTINNDERNLQAVHFYTQFFSGEQSVFYAGGIDHARALAKLLQDAGINAVAVDSRNNNNEDLIERFKNREIDVIVNAEMLIEGFDHDGITSVFIMTPSQSKVVVGQSRPRGLTPDPDNNPNKVCTIIEFWDQTRVQNPGLLFEEVFLNDHIDTTGDMSLTIEDMREALDIEIDKRGGRRDFSTASSLCGFPVISEISDIDLFHGQREANMRSNLRMKGIILGEPPADWIAQEELITTAGMIRPWVREDYFRVFPTNGWMQKDHRRLYQSDVRGKPEIYFSPECALAVMNMYEVYINKRNIDWALRPDNFGEFISQNNFGNVAYRKPQEIETIPENFISFSDMAEFLEIPYHLLRRHGELYFQRRGSLAQVKGDEVYGDVDLIGELPDFIQEMESQREEVEGNMSFGDMAAFFDVSDSDLPGRLEHALHHAGINGPEKDAIFSSRSIPIGVVERVAQFF